MKKCSKCGHEKNLDEFHNNKSKKDGKATECKECKSKLDVKYREENSEYYKNYQTKYWSKNRAILYKQKKEYIANNKVDHLTRQHNWYEKNKEEVKSKISKYKKEHPEQYQMYNNKRMAQKKTSIVDNFTIQEMIEKYGRQCVYCKEPFTHIDHYIPLSRGGPHTLENVRPSCEQCNLQKNNKLPDDFLKYKGITNE